MLHPIIPEDEKRLKEGIAALSYQIQIETDEKSKTIFQQTLKQYQEALTKQTQ